MCSAEPSFAYKLDNDVQSVANTADRNYKIDRRHAIMNKKQKSAAHKHFPAYPETPPDTLPQWKRYKATKGSQHIPNGRASSTPSIGYHATILHRSYEESGTDPRSNPTDIHSQACHAIKLVVQTARNSSGSLATPYSLPIAISAI